ncbi:MAG: hypothetical protein QS721_01435 [Candidatus Endonucleobacter sp. (ex Gigantidas childressi)]|nr:hypothetical protein [Candidatus Endonucleobacter sp. (ex Gigantidas childressi)]
MGLAKNATIYGLAAIAANIRKGTKFLMLYGVSKTMLYRIGTLKISQKH